MSIKPLIRVQLDGIREQVIATFQDHTGEISKEIEAQIQRQFRQIDIGALVREHVEGALRGMITGALNEAVHDIVNDYSLREELAEELTPMIKRAISRGIKKGPLA